MPRSTRQRGATLLSLAALCLLTEDTAGFAISSSARASPRAAPRMAQTVDGVRVGPPPDLPSLLLSNRIVYIGMPLVPSVTELVVAQLLYLNYDNPSKEVYMYLNSVGTGAGQQQFAFETEAFAIADTMNYVSPEIDTICLGTAFGTAAMLLANGEKGKRSCLPNSMMMLQQPRSMARGQASDIAIKAREVLASRQTILTMLSESTGQTIDKLQQDSSRTKYLNAEQALAYGIVDKILKSEDDLPAKPTFLSAL
jgi:ATP-dependent Clp protease protease subunit